MHFVHYFAIGERRAPELLVVVSDEVVLEDEAREQRADGQQASLSLKAIADRQAVEIVAAASKDSEIIRGEGDAERNRVFAEAFQKDPEFFAFYRSMQAYQKSLGTQGTTMVLNPQSEFFRYFGDQKPGAAGAPAAPAPAQPAQ